MQNVESSAEKDPRIYFAAERTFLAWVRTGLALIAVGFAVSRFSLFLRELSVSAARLIPHTEGLSLWAGVGLVGLGVVVNISAVWRYLRITRQLSSGTWVAGKVSKSAIGLGCVLAAAGIAMAAYLVFIH